MKRKERRKSVLLIQHAPHEHPAALRRALESQGIRTLWIHPYRGDKYPKLSEIAGIVSLGGPMGANDDSEHPWIRKECDLLKASAESGLPTVGICLGGQMLARSLGGRVERNAKVELGWFPVELNDAGRADPVAGVAGKTPTVYQWHQDTFHLPKSAVLLASSKACARQAFRVGEKAYGFQFHPEADHQLVHEWLSIEGVEEEILEVQKAHGKSTVQDGKTQKNRALRGEKASLKITAAIASLFPRKERDPAPADLVKKVTQWATQGKKLIVAFEGSDRRIMHIEGKIVTLLSIPSGRFVVLQESNALLWPIRIEDIREIAVRKASR